MCELKDIFNCLNKLIDHPAVCRIRKCQSSLCCMVCYPIIMILWSALYPINFVIRL